MLAAEAIKAGIASEATCLTRRVNLVTSDWQSCLRRLTVC